MERGQIGAPWIGGILAALLVGAVGVWALTSGTAHQIVRGMVQGGEWQLRDPMRPIRGGDRVLLIALDGVGDDTLRGLIRQGRMPRLAALVGPEHGDGLYAHAFAATDAMSIVPSTTMAAWTSVYTGQPAGRTGVPGNEWFDREHMRFYAPGPTSVQSHEHTARLYTDGLLDAATAVPTLFELVDLRAHVSLAPIARGADLLTTPSVTDVAALFGRLAEGVVDDDPVEREPYAALDTSSVERVLEAMEEHGVPDLQVVYLPGIDLYTHVTEPPLPELARYLEEIVDPAIGALLDAYAGYGALQRTWVVFTSDHGHTPVLDDDRHAIGQDDDGSPVTLLSRAGFRERPLELEPDTDDYQAVVAYQGAIAYVYLADRSTCPDPGTRCDWAAPPRLDEDVLPVARAFYEANQTGAHVPELHDTLDLIFARRPGPLGQDTVPFQVFDGQRLVPIGEHLALHPRSDLVQLEARMHGLAVGPHGHKAGDILLLAKSGANRPIEERYYFSSLYHSWHGSPERQDSHIPLLVARAGGSGAELQSRLQGILGEQPSQLHVVPVVRALLDR